MTSAFLSVGHGPKLLIGSDIPAVSRQHIRLAFKQLNSVDAIFGACTRWWVLAHRTKQVCGAS